MNVELNNTSNYILKKISFFLAVFVLLTVLSTSASAIVLNTIEVSQPVQLTSNAYYERGQSLIFDGSNYWLFYGRSDSVTGNYGNGNPDTHDYRIYYKKAPTIEGLASATPTLLNAPHNANIYLGETDAAYYVSPSADVRVYAAVDVGNQADLYQFYTNDNGATWNENIITTGLPDGAAHFASTSCDGKLWFAYQLGNDWKSKYWNGGWSAEFDITDNYGTAKFYCEGTDLYFARADGGDQDIWHWNGSSWNSIDSSTEVGPYDPTIFKKDGYYVFAYAPWDGTKQYIKAKVAAALNSILSAPTHEVNITLGGYDSNPWVDMWPTAFTDQAGDIYLFYTSERNPADPSNEITGNIWYLKVNWNTSNDHYTYIKNAVTNASSGDTINVQPGTYLEGLITINKDLAIDGDDLSKPVLNPIEDTRHTDHRGWLQPDGTVEVEIRDLQLVGSGKNIENAIRYQNGATGGVYNCDISHIYWSKYIGIGIVNVDYGKYGGGPLLDLSPEFYVKDCTFDNIERIGISCFGVDECIIQNNTYTGKGNGDWLDYAVEVGGGGHATISNNDFFDCTGVASSDGSTSAGILVTTYFGTGTTANIHDNYLHDNTMGIAVGYDASDTSTVTANYNDIYNNASYGIQSTAPQVDAKNNWWGDASGPYHATLNPSGTGNAVSDNVDFNPWLYDEKDNVGGHTYDSDGDNTVDTSGIPGMDSMTFDSAIPGHWVNINEYESDPTPAPSTIGFLGHYYEISTDMADGTFTVTIVFSYTDAELAAAGISEDDDLITVTYWDGSAWQPIAPADIVWDKVANTVTVTLNHFTPFSIIAATTIEVNDITPDTAKNGEDDVGIIDIDVLNGAAFDDKFDSLTIRVNASELGDIEMVKIYKDRDNDGVFEPGADDGAPIRQRSTINPWGNKVVFNNFNQIIPAGTEQHFFVAFDIMASAFNSNTVDAWIKAGEAVMLNAGSNTIDLDPAGETTIITNPQATINLYYSAPTNNLRVWGNAPDGTSYAVINVVDIDNNLLFTYAPVSIDENNEYDYLIDVSAFDPVKYNIVVQFYNASGDFISEVGGFFDNLYMIWVEGRITVIENELIPDLNEQIQSANCMQ